MGERMSEKILWTEIILVGIGGLISIVTLIMQLVGVLFSPRGIFDSIVIDGGVAFLAVALFIDLIYRLPKKEKRVKML